MHSNKYVTYCTNNFITVSVPSVLQRREIRWNQSEDVFGLCPRIPYSSFQIYIQPRRFLSGFQPTLQRRVDVESPTGSKTEAASNVLLDAWNFSLDVCDPEPRIYAFVCLFRSRGHA